MATEDFEVEDLPQPDWKQAQAVLVHRARTVLAHHAQLHPDEEVRAIAFYTDFGGDLEFQVNVDCARLTSSETDIRPWEDTGYFRYSAIDSSDPRQAPYLIRDDAWHLAGLAAFDALRNLPAQDPMRAEYSEYRRRQCRQLVEHVWRELISSEALAPLTFTPSANLGYHEHDRPYIKMQQLKGEGWLPYAISPDVQDRMWSRSVGDVWRSGGRATAESLDSESVAMWERLFSEAKIAGEAVRERTPQLRDAVEEFTAAYCFARGYTRRRDPGSEARAAYVAEAVRIVVTALASGEPVAHPRVLELLEKSVQSPVLIRGWKGGVVAGQPILADAP